MTAITDTVATVTARILALQGIRNARLTRVDEGSVRYIITEPFASEIVDMLQAIEDKFAEINPLEATGTCLDALVVDRLLDGRQPGEKATGTLTFSSSYPAVGDVTIPVGTRVAYRTAAGGLVIFVTTEVGTILNGAYSGDAEAEAYLPGLNGNASDTEITIMYDPIPNVERVVNSLAFAGGTAEEDDDSLRQRYFDAVWITGKATQDMIEDHLTDMSKIVATRVFNRGSGDVEIIFDRSSGIAEPWTDLTDAIKAEIGCGCTARGCLAATVVGGVVTPDVGDAYGGDVWVRPLNHVIARDQWNFLYIDMIGRTRSGSVDIPAGTHRGDAIKAVLQTGDKAVSIPANAYAGPNTLDVLIGNGVYPHLWNIPEQVLVACVINVSVNDTASATIRADIEASVAHFLNSHIIGQDAKYSQIEAKIHEDDETGENFTGIEEITLFQASGNGQTMNSNGQHIDIDDDQRIRAGSVTVTITVI